MLSVKGVSRWIGRKAVVDDVTFHMARGEVVALLGPSGSGKTSLLRLIAGFDAADGGVIELHGVAVSARGRVLIPPERRGLAVAFQDATLFPHLDAVANVAFAIRTGDQAARGQRARAILREMGLTDLEGRDVATLSGGEAQRVSLARALAAAADLLLLDEPFGNVDRLTRADLVVRLRTQLDQGQGAILITHDPADALELGARVLLMHRGRLVTDATLDDIASGACGEWPRSFLDGKCQEHSSMS